MALLVGFALDQQVTVQKAFVGPARAARAARLARRRDARRRRPRAGLPRAAGDPPLPGLDGQARARARRPRARPLRRRRRPRLDRRGRRRRAARQPRGAAGLRRDEGQGARRRARQALRRRGCAEPLVPWHPTLGDVDSPQALRATRRPSACTRPAAPTRPPRPRAEITAAAGRPRRPARGRRTGAACRLEEDEDGEGHATQDFRPPLGIPRPVRSGCVSPTEDKSGRDPSERWFRRPPAG